MDVEGKVTRLERLIEELCPDGVEVVELGDVVRISNGRDHKHLAEGLHPVYGSGGIMRYADDYLYDKPSVLIPRKGSVENVFFVDKPFWTVDTIFYTRINIDSINPRFLYHLMLKENLGSLNIAGGVPSLTKSVLDKVLIPLPPLEIQEQIVAIMDCYTQLEAELEAELEARKQQYEFYRDFLLDFPPEEPQADQSHLTTKPKVEYRWMNLDGVSKSVSTGGTPKADNPEYYDGEIPWLRTQEVRFTDIHTTEKQISLKGLNNSSAKWIPADCVIVAISGATAGRAGINKIPLTTNQHCCNFEVDPSIAHYRYVYHWVCKEFDNLRNLRQGPRLDLSVNIIKNYHIPIPSLEEQARIVAALDRFDELVNNLTDGLPAEITARRKQYEHYRDNLLTFKQKP